MKVNPLPSLAALALLLAFGLTGCGFNARPSIQVTGSAFNFGTVMVARQATRTVVTITNTATEAATLTAKLTGDPSLTLREGLSCGQSLGAGGQCSMVASFLPTQPQAASGSLLLTLATSAGSIQKTVNLTGSGEQLSPGQSLVETTINPVVARYTYQPDVAGNVSVQFGPDTSYGLNTSSIATPPNGGPVSILVAGMRQNMTYHMRAVVTAGDGTVTTDQDHTFTTGSFPAAMLPTISVTTPPGLTPQPGIELADAALSSTNTDYLGAYATDLQGNIIWGYNFPDRPTVNTIIQPIKLLPNGHFLLTLSFASQYVLPGQGVTLTPADESIDLIREIDLAGDPVQQITIATLNQKLAAAGYNLTLNDIHHDVDILPNGHLILIANMLKTYNNLTGYPGATNVLGDVLVDLDTNFNVSWVWSEFDHLDVNRHPIGFPDWTHTNTVLYSSDDGDLLVSSRHQSWIFKVDYDNGKGSGNILWRLGNGGDFTLIGGTAPQDWFYGQHEPSFVGTATSGNFSLTMMDNGYGRIYADGTQCGDTTSDPCYTTVPILAIDEAAKTATVTFRQTVPTAQYNVFGGNAAVLADGHLEYDLCADPFEIGSVVNEVTTGSNPQTVWSMTETGANLYRAHRIPSLYPGVQW